MSSERILHVPGDVLDDDLRLPEHVDPARWPFCEARARAAAALSAFPPPPMKSRDVERSRRSRNMVLEAQQRRARQRGVS